MSESAGNLCSFVVSKSPLLSLEDLTVKAATPDCTRELVRSLVFAGPLSHSPSLLEVQPAENWCQDSFTSSDLRVTNIDIPINCSFNALAKASK